MSCKGSESSENQPLLNDSANSNATLRRSTQNGAKTVDEKRSVKNLCRYLTRTDYAYITISVLFCTLLSALLYPCSILVLTQPIDVALAYEERQKENNRSFVYIRKSMDNLAVELKDSALYSLIICSAIVLIMITCNFANMYMFGLVAVRLSRILREKLLSQILRLDMAWASSRSTDELVSIFDEKVEKVSECLGNKVPQLCMITANVFSVFLFSVLLRADLTLLLVCITVVYELIFYFGRMKYLKKSADELLMRCRADQIVSEALQYIKTVICYNGQKQTIQNYKTTMTEAMDASSNRTYWSTAADVCKNFLIDALVICGMSYGILTLADGDPSITFSIVFMFYNQVSNLPMFTSHWHTINEAIQIAHEIQGILELEPAIEGTSGEFLYNITPAISFENVTFSSTTSGEAGITNFSFKLFTGERVAIVGKAGCGTECIAPLLMRLYDPTSGDILVNEHPIQTLDLDWLRQQIGYIGPKPVLYNMSIYENIQCSNETATHQEIVQALQMANAIKFVLQFPDGIHTVVNEGINLSHSQKQRIAIARAVVRDPAILIFDHVTSLMDNENEEIIQSVIDKVTKGRTALILTDRPSTVQKANEIYVVKSGAVVENGTFKQIVNDQGYFFHFLESEEYRTVLSQSETSDTDATITADRIVKRRGKAVQLMGSRQSSTDANSRPVSFIDVGSLTVSLISSIEYLLGQSAPRHHFNTSPHESKKNRHKLESVALLLSLEPPVKWLAPLLVLMGMLCAMKIIIFMLLMALQLNACIYPYEVIMARFMGIIVVFCVIEVVGVLAEVCLCIPMSKYADQLGSTAGCSLLSHYLEQNVVYFDSPPHNHNILCATMKSHMATIRKIFAETVPALLINIPLSIFGLIMIMCVGPVLSIIAIALFCTCVILRSIQARVAKNQIKKLQLLEDKTVFHAAQALTSLETVKAYSLERYLTKRYNNDYAEVEKQQRTCTLINSFVFAMDSCIPLLVLSVMLCAGSYLMLQWPITVYSMWAVIMIANVTINHLSSLLSNIRNFPHFFASCQRITETLMEMKTGNYMTNAGLTPDIQGDVCFNGVHFHYPSSVTDQSIFSEFNMEVQAGKTVALIGAPDSGKNTVPELMLKLHDCVSGNVTIDNINISAINPQHLHSQVMPLFREPILFTDTVRNNICYGIDEQYVNHDVVCAAARAANIHNLIVTLPQGYDTWVGNSGTKLSTFDKQRIALARAIIRNPKILLIDDISASLQKRENELMQETLKNMLHSRTCILTNGKMNMVQNADMIMVFSDGKVVEKGTHSQLMRRDNLYYQMYMRHKWLE